MVKSKIALVVAAIAASAFALTASVFAAPPQGHNTPENCAVGYGNTRPGNGFGDNNHCHTGPPGQNKKNP